MRAFKASIIIVAAFLFGLVATPAYSAVSVSGWEKIFGHSTSCGMGQAGVNNSPERASGQTKNFKGCSSSNSQTNVPAGYLGAESVVVRYDNNAFCGYGDLSFNNAAASSKTTLATRSVFANGCWAPGYYYGMSNNVRKSDAGKFHPIQRVTNLAIWFSGTLI